MIPGLGRSPGEGNGNPLQYYCLENPMPRGAWQATAHGVARVGHDLATKPSPPVGEDTEAQRNSLTHAKPHSGSTYLSWSDTVSLSSLPSPSCSGFAVSSCFLRKSALLHLLAASGSEPHVCPFPGWAAPRPLFGGSGQQGHSMTGWAVTSLSWDQLTDQSSD